MRFYDTMDEIKHKFRDFLDKHQVNIENSANRFSEIIEINGGFFAVVVVFRVNRIVI